MLGRVLKRINYKMQIGGRLARVYQWYLILIGSLFTGITFFKRWPNAAAALVQQRTGGGEKSRGCLANLPMQGIVEARKTERKKDIVLRRELQSRIGYSK